MVRVENECAECPQGCVDCGRKRSRRFYCDQCGEGHGAEDLYMVDGDMLCSDCLLSRYRKASENL